MIAFFSGRLIDQCSNVPEFKKVVVADYLAEIIDACLKSDDTVLSQHSLSCLNTCILKFPGSCLPFKNHIEASLSKCLDYQGEDVAFLKKAAVAYHYMNQVNKSDICVIFETIQLSVVDWWWRNRWNNSPTQLDETT